MFNQMLALIQKKQTLSTVHARARSRLSEAARARLRLHLQSVEEIEFIHSCMI
jgi:hypothetical protein